MIAAFLAQYGWNLLIMGLLIVAFGLIAGSDTALFRLSRAQLYEMSHSRHRLSRMVPLVMRSPGRVINTLLVLDNLVNIAYAAVSAGIVLSLERQGASAWVLAVFSVVPLVVFILLGDVLPKMIAYAWSRRWAMLAAWPLITIMRVLSPPLKLLEKVLVDPLTRVVAPRRVPADITTDELGQLVDLSARRGIIAHDTRAMLQEIVGLTGLKVGDIMVPRVDMVAFDIRRPTAELVELFRGTHLRKIPVYDGQPDNILGVIYGKSVLLEAARPLAELVVKIPFVPEAANIERLLIQFRVTRLQMAFVVDEFGGVAGLVTLQDIVEEIVGEIPDAQQPAQPAVQQVEPGKYIVDGDLAIHEWADVLKIDPRTLRVNTLGGLVMSLLGRLPRAGDQARYRNLRFTVVALRGRRISKLMVELTGGER